jgi:hypothetical protein
MALQGLGEQKGEAEAARQALRRAALRSCLSLAQANLPGRDAEELAGHVRPLAEAIWQHAFNGLSDPHLAVAPLPAATLLHALRRDFLEELSIDGERVGLPVVIKVLRSMEDLSILLDDDPAQRFV